MVVSDGDATRPASAARTISYLRLVELFLPTATTNAIAKSAQARLAVSACRTRNSARAVYRLGLQALIRQQRVAFPLGSGQDSQLRLSTGRHRVSA